jgi:DNA recombination protein RmuC
MSPELLMSGLAAALGALFAGLVIYLLPPRERDAERLQRLQSDLQTELQRLDRAVRDEHARSRTEQTEAAGRQRQELGERLQLFLEEARAGRREQTETLAKFGEQQAQQALALRSGVEEGLKTLRQENTDKLEQMRRTVDEKLHETLERRLGESFKLVSDRLEQVHKGLGEMQTLASGVGDLKRVLTNVKSRGIFGEVQLAALLEQVLTIEQYAANIATKPGSDARVEYAIRLPGRSDDGTPVWLPIDAKFPREDYERLIEAQERADPDAAALAAVALERRIRAEAQTIADKYLSPPHTTDFAILFVPVEGLYAEVLRRPGLFEEIQRKHRVTVAGPTNLLAFLNSLQMGFRTLALEKRSSEVWQVLGAVKTEFDKFGDVLDKVRKKLDEASNQLDNTGVRTRAITRRLKTVQALPEADSERLLGGASESGDED